MVGIIVKNYEHFNRSMPNWDSPKGKYIGSKKQYIEEMAKNDMVSFEKCNQMVAKNQKDNSYKGVSAKTMRFLKQVKDLADKDGNIQPTTKFIKGLKEHGVRLDTQWDKLPKSYQGGFSE